MRLNDWLDNLVETGEEEWRLKIILKSGNELDVFWAPDVDTYGTDDELTNGNWMIDTRSIAAIVYVDRVTGRSYDEKYAKKLAEETRGF